MEEHQFTSVRYNFKFLIYKIEGEKISLKGSSLPFHTYHIQLGCFLLPSIFFALFASKFLFISLVIHFGSIVLFFYFGGYEVASFLMTRMLCMLCVCNPWGMLIFCLFLLFLYIFFSRRFFVVVYAVFIESEVLWIHRGFSSFGMNGIYICILDVDLPNFYLNTFFLLFTYSSWFPLNHIISSRIHILYVQLIHWEYSVSNSPMSRTFIKMKILLCNLPLRCMKLLNRNYNEVVNLKT